MIWTCLAWVSQSEHFDRCSQPAVIVDPVFGGPVCAQHRRTTVPQDMTCRECGRTIQPGERFEFTQADHKRQKDGSDQLICAPCLRRQISETLAALGRVPASGWEEKLSDERPRRVRDRSASGRRVR